MGEKNLMIDNPSQIKVPNAEVPAEDLKKGVWINRESVKERKQTLEELFSSFPAARANAMALVKSQQGDGWSNYESRSALLEKNAEHAPENRSLSERVRGLLGRI